jgi:prophage DNA circulation protein
MSAEDLVAEIRRVHVGMEHSALRLGELSRMLLLRARNGVTSHTASESGRKLASSHVTYANAWSRLSGLVMQAIRRTHVADRALDQDRGDLVEEQRRADDAARRTTEREAREAREAAESAPGVPDRRRNGHENHRPEGRGSKDPVISALMELLGEEIVNDAAR